MVISVQIESQELVRKRSCGGHKPAAQGRRPSKQKIGVGLAAAVLGYTSRLL